MSECLLQIFPEMKRDNLAKAESLLKPRRGLFPTRFQHDGANSPPEEENLIAQAVVSSSMCKHHLYGAENRQ